MIRIISEELQCMKNLLTVILCLISLFSLSQSMTTIKGYAPSYLGEKVKVYAFEDYVSRVNEKLAETRVQTADSTFEMTFYNSETRQLKVEIGKNHFYLYVEPDADYTLFVKGYSPYLSKEAVKVEAEFFFIDLDSTDINYRILMFEDAQLNFLKANYNRTAMESTEFVAALDTFKMQCSENYQEDTSTYFKNYVLYSFASLDNLPYRGNRNRFEKYDFYIKPQTVLYKNDRYMDYILKYYDKYTYQLANPINQKFYEGVINASPTLVMNAIGGDYALKNIRLREVVMIKMLGDVFYSGDYPQTNILTMLDSISEYGLFQENKPIAKNLKYRLLDLVPGSKMPDFLLPMKNETKSKNDFIGNHAYLQFIRKGSLKSQQDLLLLKPLFEKYGKYSSFVTILVVEEGDELLKNPDPYRKEHKISWDLAVIEEDDPLLDRLSVTAFPHYILMDATGHVVMAPALSPRPDNEYDTIEKMLFNIYKRRKAMEEQGR